MRPSALTHPPAIDAHSPVKILMPLPVNMLRIYETNKDTMRKQRAKPAGQTVCMGDTGKKGKSGSGCRCRPKLGRWWGRERPPVNWIRACIAGSGNKFCITSAGATRRPDMAPLYVASVQRSSPHWTIARLLSRESATGGPISMYLAPPDCKNARCRQFLTDAGSPQLPT